MNVNFHGGIRSQWQFQYTAAQLAFGARYQKAYRENRVVIWQTKYDEVMEEMQKHGITVTHSVASSLGTMSYKDSRSIGPKVSLDKDLEDKLAQCAAKVKEHENLAAEYEGWIQTLEAQPNKQLEVTQQDFLFFFMNVKDVPQAERALIPTAPPTEVSLTPARVGEVVVNPMLVPEMPAPSLPAFVSPPLMKPAKAAKTKLEVPAGLPSVPASSVASPAPTLMAPPSNTAIFIPPQIGTAAEPNPPGFLDDWPQD